jgi:hypothetical protein
LLKGVIGRIFEFDVCLSDFVVTLVQVIEIFFCVTDVREANLIIVNMPQFPHKPVKFFLDEASAAADTLD